MVLGNKRIILIQPSYPSSPFHGAYLPVGIGYLAEHLAVNDIEYAVVDLSFTGIEELYVRIEQFKPTFVGVSIMSLDIEHHYRLISDIKSQFSDLILIAGGPHMSFLKEEALSDCPSIDIGVIREGEESLVDILNNRKYEDIPGILYRKKNKIYFSGKRDLQSNLDRFRFPSYQGFDLSMYGKKMDIISSRGCPYRCTFCGAHFSMGKRWRGRSVDSIVQEIEHWYEKGYKEFNFVDSNFFFERQRVVGLCDALKDKNLCISITSDGMRADDADMEMLVRMKESGLRSVAIGVESANDDILESIKKGEKLSQIATAIENCINLDIRVSLFFIIGLPGETRQNIENSFRFALHYPVESAYFFNANPLPKTELYEWAKNNSFLLYSPDEILKNIGGMGDEPLIATPELDREERRSLCKKGRKISSMVKRRYKLKKHIEAFTLFYDKIKSRLLFTLLIRPRFGNIKGRIFTHITDGEQKILMHLASKIPKAGIILEIGSYLGASASCFAYGCRKKEGTVFSVDTWENDAMTEGGRDTYSLFMENTKIWNETIVPLRGRSADIAAGFRKKIDLLFIDADHSYKGCSTDIKAWFPHLNNGATVVFHDYAWSEGVRAAVTEQVKAAEFDKCAVFENLYWARMLK